MRHIIIGAGLAGHRAALELRQLSEEDQIVLIGAEKGLPYDRPPLSKDSLTNGLMASPLPKADQYQALGIDYRPDTMIESIDAETQTVFSQSGQAVQYDRLLLATGSRVRRLPASITNGCPVHYMRTADDAMRINTLIGKGKSLLIIGGGFIGLEIAAAARQAGSDVIVIEAAERVLSRAVPHEVSTYLTDLHSKEGVDIRLNTRIETLAPDGKTCIAHTTGGHFSADAIIAGIGVIPNTDLAEQTGLEVSDGIVVDDRCRTSAPHIFAAGEVTRHPCPYTNDLCRLEAWHIANKQPAIAARAMTGQDASYSEPPWFWSDQFGQNLQMIGMPDLVSDTTVIGDLASPRWAIVGTASNGRPVMGIAMNNGRYISKLRREMPKQQPLPDGFFG